MLPNTLAEIIIDQRYRLEELERRMENRQRTGTIAEVNAKDGLARVKIDTDDKSGQPFLTPWIPWKEVSMGAIKTHFPPSVGEQVKVVSESGDLTDAQIDFSTPSNSNERPHDKEAEGVIQIGDTRLLITGGKVVVKSGEIILDGNVHLGGEGGKLVHRKGDVDSDGDLAVGSASKVYAV